MPDAMDHVQQLTDDLTADALARHAAKLVVPGRTACINQDCAAPIAASRTAFGAQRCVVCQREHEARAAHFAAWGHR